MYQKLIIIGNLGGDPEAKFLPSGDPVSQFSVATSRRYGEKDETTWFRVSVFGKQADSCNQYLHKGSRVLVEGRLRPEIKPYQRKDGTWAASYDVRASDVRFLSSKADDAPVEPSADQDVPF